MRLPIPALVLAGLLVLTASAYPAAAQQPRADPDPAAELYQAALLLEAEGEHQLADSLFDYILRRFPDSDVAALIRTTRGLPGGRRTDGDGRTELVVWSTLYGLWLGVAIPATFSASGTEPYGLGLLVGGPAGFALARAVTRNSPITDGEAATITWGGGWGTWQGFGWAQVLDLGNSCDELDDLYQYCDPGPSAEAVFGSMVVGGLLGTGVGVLATRRMEISGGDAAMLNLGSLWGTWYGFALAVLADVEDEDPMMATTLVGGNLGALAGLAIARNRPVTRSQARMASIIGVVGGLAGAGVDLIVQPESEKVAVAIPTALSALGLVLGASYAGLWTRDQRDGTAESPALGGVDWTPGGPIVPVLARGPGGEYRTGLGVTLVSARF